MEQKPESVKLTLWQAKKLIATYIGVSPKLQGDEILPGGYCYGAKLGCLEIRCENDWDTQNGRIKLAIYDLLGENGFEMYFHPDTLERDFETEDSEKRAELINSCRAWVLTQGLARCHQVVNRLWNGERDVW